MSGPVQPPLTVETVDGATVGRPITRIKVTNGTLAVSGSTATLTISGGGGGSGTVTSIGLTETGSALTITGSPVTTSGTINIAGAGTSSQVILGDLSLGTLTSGTVTSVGLTETGTALTITGSPVTTSGSINIAGAGTSSQVILGDLSLGTLTSGTVTSVGTSQAFISIASPTTTPSISIGNASGAATGVLTATDWTTFNGKQDSITLTTTGSSGAATLVGSTLNIPQYSGGGGVTFPLEADSGSLSAPSYSFSGDTNTGMYAPSANTLGFTVGGNERLNVANDKVSGIAFQTSGTNNATFPDYQFTADPDTGMFKAAPNQIGFSTGGSEKFRFSDGGGFGIGGANYGTSGQVLTSAGPTSPPTWSTASGGSSNAFEKILPQVGSMSAANQYNVAVSAPWGGGQIITQAISSMALGARPYAFPFIAPETATVSAVGVVITTAESGVDLYVGIYENDSNNLPSTRLGYATIDMSSTGTIYSTSIVGTLALTAGEQYWYSINTSGNVFNGILDAVSTSTGIFSATPLGLTDDINDLNYSIKDTTVSANAVPPSTYSTDDLDGSANRIVVGLKF